MKLKGFHIIDFRFQFDKHFFVSTSQNIRLRCASDGEGNGATYFDLVLFYKSKNVYEIAHSALYLAACTEGLVTML